MPKRLSVDARKVVLTSAIEEVRHRGDRRLGTTHLLLGILHDDGSAAVKALGVSLAEARSASDALDIAALAAVGIEVERLGEGPPTSFGRRVPPLTSGARAVLKRAIDEARLRKSRYIDTMHLVLALLSLRHPDPAADLLEALGVDPAAVRRRLDGREKGETE